MTTLLQLIGRVDNSQEPIPLANHRSVFVAVSCAGLVCTWVCVSLRLYTRFRVVKAQGWDDLFVTLAACSGTVGAVSAMLGTNTGLGQHILTLTPAQIPDYFRLFWLANATYPCSTALIKLALLLQFARVYERGSRLWYCVVALTLIITLWGVAYGFLAWVPCLPVRAYWELGVPATRYAYGTTDVGIFIGTYESHTAANVLLDVLVLTVAVPMFWKQGMRAPSYWGLTGLFVLGAVVNMLSIWRLVVIVSTQAATYPTFDPTWYAPTAVLLAALEVDVATICASLPVFWPVIQQQLNHIFVTREVQITREFRRPYSTSTSAAGEEEEGNESPYQEDEFGERQRLNRKASSGATTFTTKSSSLKESQTRDGQSRRDSYVMRRVVPFDAAVSASPNSSKPTLETKIEALHDSETGKARFTG